MNRSLYTCEVDAEPLEHYLEGGYHPIHLGDLLKDGRYKILHKLGWGSYSTVWAARDQINQRYVAVKVTLSKLGGGGSQELKVLRAIEATSSEQIGSQYLIQILDHFQLNGPNGSHNCLVFELLGPSIYEFLKSSYQGKRLPRELAKRIAKQALLGLKCMHEQKIAHGDLHSGNLACTIPSTDSLNEDEVLGTLGTPESPLVSRRDGKPTDPSVPKYLVRPAAYPVEGLRSVFDIKLIDFGESFFENESPKTVHTSLSLQAPEVVFGDKLDYRVDLWSMGCLLFELVAGQPPFVGSIGPIGILVYQMMDTTKDKLPERWQEKWRAMGCPEPVEESSCSLQKSLEELYFYGKDKLDFTREDLLKAGELIRKLLRLEPSARASATEILQDPWFDDQ